MASHARPVGRKEGPSVFDLETRVPEIRPSRLLPGNCVAELISEGILECMAEQRVRRHTGKRTWKAVPSSRRWVLDPKPTNTSPQAGATNPKSQMLSNKGAQHSLI